MNSELTAGELAILTLLAESPRHGYEIEALIEARNMREWVNVAFSSIYYLLGRLEKRGLAASSPTGGSPRTRRPFSITATGQQILLEEAIRTIVEPRRASTDVLIGIANWPMLDGGEGQKALDARMRKLEAERARLQAARSAAQAPDFVSVMFDYALGQIQADLDWTAETRIRLGSHKVKVDLKKEFKALFSAPYDRFVEITVPPMNFVKVDGAGDPNEATAYRSAVEWLYGVSYAMKFAAKAVFQRDYVVPPLEALWWADDPESFVRRDKHDWHWTVMIMVPSFVPPEFFDDAMKKAAAKLGQPPASLRFEAHEEGLSLQILHIGSYDDEGPILERLHKTVMPERNVTFNGAHHEIYLGDPRKREPSKLKTILRQPIKPR